MKKAWIIAWKDTLIRLSDRSALLYLLLTPILMTLLFGSVFGGSGDENYVPPAVPIAIVNHDDGQLGQTVTDLFTTNEELDELVDATILDDEAAARAQVQAGDSYCCVVIIPAGFSRAVMDGRAASVTVFSDPASRISASLVESVVQQITAEMQSRMMTTRVTIEQLALSGRITSRAEGEHIAQAINDEPGETSSPVTVRAIDAQGEEADFNPLAVLAPGIALLFLSFGTVNGARSILAEEEMGTLARLTSTPTSALSIMSGKLLGIFLVGLLQFGALMLGSTLLFRINWGQPLAVGLLSIVLVVAFTAVGLVLAVLSRSQEQANAFGTIVSLVFAMLGGAFVQRSAFPDWLQTVGLITPNAWGNDAFIQLGLGRGLEAITPQLVGLLAMSAILFTIGVNGYQRRAVR
jgi:ABC-2 type transport system permease protein